MSAAGERGARRRLILGTSLLVLALPAVLSPGSSLAGGPPTAPTDVSRARAQTTTTQPGSTEEPTPEETTQPTEFVKGTLKQEGKPVVGVEILVADRQGREVGRTTTDERGAWRLGVPGPGRYVVTLLQESLPEGVKLRDPEHDTREVLVLSGQERVVLFALGEGAAVTRRPFAQRVTRAAANGVKFGLIVAMAAIGLSLIFGTTGLVNFAHSELVTFGAIVAWYLNASGPRLPLVGAAALTMVIAGLLGAALERGLWRPLRERKVGSFQLLVISIGLALLGRHALLIVFGGRSKPYADYAVQTELDIGPLSITPRDLVVMGLSVVVLLGVALALQRTRVGKAMRAVSDNVDLAEASGIDVRRIVMVTWVGGTALAALGGILLGTVETVNWLMGFRLLLLMFAAVILGGLGSAYGALAGALVIGLATEVSTVWVSPELKFVWALLALILVLLVRPQGILGIRERVG